MKSSSILTSILALLAVGAGAVAWRQYQELNGLRRAALDTSEREALQKQISELERANRELSDHLADARAEMNDAEPADLDAATDERPADMPRERPRVRRGDNPSRQQVAFRELMARPEVQAALNLQRQLGIEQRYAALFKNLNLSPDQAEKLKVLLAERQNTVQDIMLVGREQGINPRTDPEGFRKLIAAAETEFNQSIQSVIGETGFTQLKTYEQTLPQRALVNDIQERLSYTTTPLTPAQSEQLIQILAATSGHRGNASDPTRPEVALTDVRSELMLFSGGAVGFSPARTRGGNVPITADVINQAQGILAEPQLNALRQLQQQQQAQQQMQQLIRSTLQNNRRRGPAGGGAAAPGTAGGTAPRG